MKRGKLFLIIALSYCFGMFTAFKIASVNHVNEKRTEANNAKSITGCENYIQGANFAMVYFANNQEWPDSITLCRNYFLK
jgi:hypothetical protein